MNTACPFAPSHLVPHASDDLSFTEHLASAHRSLVPKVSGFLGILGRLIWFVPALVLAALVWSINRSDRKSELLESVRLSLQSFSAVTSPIKIALLLLVMVLVWFAESLPPSRLVALITLGGVAAVSFAGVVMPSHVGGFDSLALVLPCAIATAVSLVWAARTW